MKIRIALALATTATALMGQMAIPKPLPDPFGPPQRQWARLADGKAWGTTAGIEIGPKGEIWAIDRCGGTSCDGSNMAAVHQIDPKTGRPMRSLGAGLFAMPHGLHVDKDGNVWVTDAAIAKQGGPEGQPKGQQVIKLSPDGKVLMRLGVAGVSGGGPTHFHDPGDVITAPNGDIFVADGHGTVAPDLPKDTVTRIIKFSADGTFIKSWGSLGSGKSQFRNPHVADRVNGRIQVFDQNGKWLTEYRSFNHPSGLFIARDGLLYASDYNSEGQKGVYIGDPLSGTLKAFVPDAEAGEGVALGPDGVLYEATPTGITRFLPKKSAAGR
jgi:DNA-binding beta-propeller fold protein YncE